MRLALRYGFFLVLLWLTNLTPLSSFVREGVAVLAIPLQIRLVEISQVLRQELSFIARLGELQQLLFKQEQKIGELENELLFWREKGRERDFLLEQAALGYPQAKKYILAQIVGREPWVESGLIWVNAGLGEGVKLEGSVIVGKGLVGVVTRVEEKRSLVRLILDTESRVAALNESSPSRSRGVVAGRFGTGLVFEGVLAGEPLRTGDLVVSSGEDLRVPKGLVLGRVLRVEKEEGKVLQKAVLEPVLNFQSLESVLLEGGP